MGYHIITKIVKGDIPQFSQSSIMVGGKHRAFTFGVIVASLISAGYLLVRHTPTLFGQKIWVLTNIDINLEFFARHHCRYYDAMCFGLAQVQSNRSRAAKFQDSAKP
ncbi:uncharacterized protein PHALS_14507 [Plasmopara halstedii]|uniref:Uncharacterized protein n=1 Tax=Plasmopara halstedii TaxID=4781 RepID=A0A0P1A6E7_PLAHL|nr:uncharacterized protein PHALS_14507 [Plasmopara halstedii]CEG35652.1 hypothetical protein PHALS_14507 [Plasmopara halstedii]|eukprot:XP_024572021.1 hypothetical protein PHALS_14507 [Plasmopara halstedii]